MIHISSEAVKAGLPMPNKGVEEMSKEEQKAFRMQFDSDSMGFDGEEGVNADESNKA